jgi:DNA-binding MarR family transcriptional regulator
MMRSRSNSEDAVPADVPDEHRSNVLFELWRLSRAASALLSDQLAGAGVTGDEFGIYSVLATVEHMTPSALARWMSAPATTVSSHVKRLEARGHVARRVDPADGRSSLLRLTTAGRRTWERATAGYLPILADVEARLGAAEPEVRAALIRLRAAIDATDR